MRTMTAQKKRERERDRVEGGLVGGRVDRGGRGERERTREMERKKEREKIHVPDNM